MRRAVKLSALAASMIAAAVNGLGAQATPAPAAPVAKAPRAWTLGIARFGTAIIGDPQSTLQELLPRLIASDLKALPLRHIPDEAVEEAARRAELYSRFLAGLDLASKLDARALRFLEPSLDLDARRDAISTADKQAAASAQKLADLASGTAAALAAPADLSARLWEGHATGLILDLPSAGLSQAAKAAAVDLLVTGTVAIQGGYAVVQVRGYDAALERSAFAWKTFCSVEDPEPLAAEVAARLERWVAGRDFGRVEVRASPASVELLIDGERIGAANPVFYSYAKTRVAIEASASGYASRRLELDLALGDRKTVDIELLPRATGSVTLSVDPAEAAIAVDSIPIGRSPVAIELDGARGIASISAPGRESMSLVLPASGESELSVKLLPADGLGPSGRISAAKDRFYRSLGWFVLCVPATTLTWGAYNGYEEAYGRSLSSSILTSRNLSIAALGAAAAAVAATATIMALRLIDYLGAAR